MIHLAALCGVLAISFSAILVRLADVSPITAAFFRAAYAVPFLAALWLATRARDARRARARALAVASGLFLAVDLILWHASIGAIGAGIATLLANTQVIFVALAAWAIHRERPSTTALAAFPLVFAGVALLSGLGAPGAYGDRPGLGVALGVAAGVFYAGYLMSLRASNRIMVPPNGPLLDATAGALLGTALGSLLVPGLDLAPHWPAHGWLLMLALTVQVAGWLLIAYTLPRLPALETSFMILLQPVGTLLWGALLFTERVSPVQGAGVVLVLAGITAVAVRGSVARPAPA